MAKSATPQLQAQANEVAVKAGCPASTKTTVNDQKYSAAPPMTIDTSKTYTATVKTTPGTFDIALDATERPPDREQLRVPGRQGLLPLRDLPPGHPGLHGPDRRPDRHGRPAVPATPSPTSTRPRRPTPPTSTPSGRWPWPTPASRTSGGSQFFIVAGSEGESLPNTYTLFGTVTSGMNVVDTINKQGSAAGRAARRHPAHFVDHHQRVVRILHRGHPNPPERQTARAPSSGSSTKSRP